MLQCKRKGSRFVSHRQYFAGSREFSYIASVSNNNHLGFYILCYYGPSSYDGVIPDVHWPNDHAMNPNFNMVAEGWDAFLCCSKRGVMLKYCVMSDLDRFVYYQTVAVIYQETRPNSACGWEFHAKASTHPAMQ